MNIDPAAILTWKDGILIGIIIGHVLNARGRRHQGERLGTVEKAVVALAKSAGVNLEDSQPGNTRRK